MQVGNSFVGDNAPRVTKTRGDDHELFPGVANYLRRSLFSRVGASKRRAYQNSSPYVFGTIFVARSCYLSCLRLTVASLLRFLLEKAIQKVHERCQA